MPGPRRSEVERNTAPRKRRWGLILGVTSGVVLLIIVVLIAAAPSIASAVAPGYIERAAAGQIKGTVKVTNLSLGWFSPTIIGPVEVRDPAGKLAARVQVATPATLWKVVSEQWWNTQRLDLGEIELAGQADIERDASGKTNLDQAIEPRNPAPAAPKPASPKPAGEGFKALKASLKIKDLDVVIREKAADGTLGPETGVRDLKGSVDINLAGGTVTTKADLNASVLGASPVGGAAAAATRINVDAIIKTAGQTFDTGKLDNVKITGQIEGAPVGVIDALAAQQGALLALLGEDADITLSADGDLKNAVANLSITSPGVNGALALTVVDGVLSTPAAAAQNANRFTIASTAFLARLPATRAAVESAARQIRLTSPEPPVELAITRLRLPLPASGAGIDAATIDARGMGVEIALNIGAAEGRVALSAPNQAAANQPNQPAAPGEWRPFRIEPTRLALIAPDLAQPVTLSGAVQAAVDGASGGTINLSATVAGLLDQAGRVRALQRPAAGGPPATLADSLDAQIQAQGVATALIQPLVAGMNLPVDLTTDVGPTLDAALTARADLRAYALGVTNAPLPPAQVTLNLTSANVRAAGELAHNAGALTTGPAGITLEIASAGPVIRRAAGPSLAVDGAGRVRAGITDLAVNLADLSKPDAMSAIRARVTAQVADLRVTPPTPAPAASTDPAQAAAPAPAPAQPAQPLVIDTADLAITLAPGVAPSIQHAGRFVHAGQPFRSAAQITLEGMKQGRLPKSAGLDLALRMGASGTFEIAELPASVLQIAPGLATMFDPASTDAVGAIVRGAVGRSATLTTRFEPILEGGAPAGTAATVTLTTAAQGVGGEIRARVTPTLASIGKADVTLTADPATLNPALAQSAKSGTTPMAIAQPFTVSLRAVEAIDVPLKAGQDGGVSPDFARAGDAVIAITSDRDIIVDNVAVGTDPSGRPTTTQVQVRRLNVEARAPIAALAGDPAGDGKQADIKAGAQILRGAGISTSGGPGAPGRIADLDATATLAFAKNAAGKVAPALRSAQAALAGLDVVAIDALLNQNGQLTGALGPTAEIRASVTPAGQGIQKLVAAIQAPKLSGADNIALTLGQDRLSLDAPANITWTPDAAFLNRVVLGAGKPGAPPPSLTITQSAPVSLRLQRLSVAMPAAATAGAPARGPMLPGVFALDASVAIPQIGATVRRGGIGAAADQPSPLTFDQIQAAVRSGQQPGAIDADLSIARISGADAAAGKPSSARASIVNLADSTGVINAKNAIFNLDADFAQFPTAIVDQLGQQKGLLVEALGPTIDLKARADNVSLAAAPNQNQNQPNPAQPGNQPAPAGGGIATGRIDATAVSPRATARLLGDIQNGAFIQAGDTGLRIIEIRPALVEQLSGGVPIVKTLEKNTTDDPAIIQAETLRVPIDGDLRKLNGLVRIDPGVARFTTQGILADVMNAVGLRTAGEVGRRIEPFVVRFEQGVANYDRFRLPIGEFSIETRGQVDLVNRRLDCVTYIPLGLMTDRAIGLFGGGGLGANLGVLDKATMFPWRLRGSLDNPSLTPDPGLFAQEAGKNLIEKPAEAIKDTLDRTIKDLFKPKEKPKN